MGGCPPKTKKDFQTLLTTIGCTFKTSDTLDKLRRLCVANNLCEPSEKDQLCDKLRLVNVSFDEKASIAHIRMLCEDNGLLDMRYERVEKFSIIKCPLRKSTSILTHDEYKTFTIRVNEYVNLISRMMRRATLLMSFHITSLLSTDDPLPNLYKQKDTYWKNLLRLETPSVNLKLKVVRKKIVVSIVVEECGFDKSLLASHNIIKDDLDEVYQDNDVNFVSNQPKYFDQVLNYAGHTLQTIVTNNAWVPLWSRLGRLCKVKLKTWRTTCEVDNDAKLHADKMMRLIRCSEPDLTTIPKCVKDWVELVREKLQAEIGKPLMDNHGLKKMTFNQIMRFNYWMQQQFRDLEVRKMRLMPIASIHRSHVRLDAKTLTFLFSDMFPSHDVVKKAVQVTKSHTQAMETEFGQGCVCSPDEKMFPEPPTKPEKDCDFQVYEEALEAHAIKVKDIRESETYKRMIKSYNEYKEGTRAVAKMFFNTVPKRGKGWEFSGSVATDGVSVSIQYKKVVMERVLPPITKVKIKPKEISIVDYDRNLSTVTNDLIVLGLDPGRNNLATISYITSDGTTKYWTLTRGQYRQVSGVCNQMRKQAQRYAHLQEGFHRLTDTTLRACEPGEIHAYLREYKTISKQWWSQALQRVESRMHFKMYMGKRRVLDSFFAKVLRTVQKQFPSHEILVAYGEAGLTMSPTGKGEVAVPTGGTFKACQRIMGTQCVIPTDEYNTTAIAWETGKKKEIVYRVVDESGDLSVDHTKDNKPPKVPTTRVQAFDKYKKALVQKEKDRRRGWFHLSNDTSVQEENQEETRRYNEVRGLRFCPERRKYVGRDEESALTIGRLLMFSKLNKGRRPRPFCRGKKTIHPNEDGSVAVESLN